MPSSVCVFETKLWMDNIGSQSTSILAKKAQISVRPALSASSEIGDAVSK